MRKLLHRVSDRRYVCNFRKNQNRIKNSRSVPSDFGKCGCFEFCMIAESVSDNMMAAKKVGNKNGKGDFGKVGENVGDNTKHQNGADADGSCGFRVEKQKPESTKEITDEK